MKRTPLKRGKPLARKRMDRKPAPAGFPESVRMGARRRSGGRCEIRTAVCTGEAAHFHHRKLRASKDHSLVNCLHLCRACHDRVHAHPTTAYLMGWLVHAWEDPMEIPVKVGEGPRQH